MLSIFLLMGLGICAAYAFGVGGLLDSPGTSRNISVAWSSCLKLANIRPGGNSLAFFYLVLGCNWITLVVVVGFNLDGGRKQCFNFF